MADKNRKRDKIFMDLKQLQYFVVCGYKNTDVKDLGVRKWICPKCGTWHDRDINAQQNIYKIGTKMLQDEGIQIIDGRENRG